MCALLIYSPCKSISKRGHIILLSLCITTSVSGSQAESLFQMRKWASCPAGFSVRPPRAHFTGTKWLFVISTVTVLWLHSKLVLGLKLSCLDFLTLLIGEIQRLFPSFLFLLFSPILSHLSFYIWNDVKLPQMDLLGKIIQIWAA